VSASFINSEVRDIAKVEDHINIIAEDGLLYYADTAVRLARERAQRDTFRFSGFRLSR